MVIAKPRMAHYLEVSGRVYGVYLRYAAPEHIHVYSIDEVFIDATPYLRALGMSPHEMASAIVRDILAQTGITATAGIGHQTCIWRRWRWTSWPSTCPPMRMAFVWRSLTRCRIGDCYGTIVRLRISGGSVAAMPGSLSMPAC